MSIFTPESNIQNTELKKTKTSDQDFIDLPLNIPDDKSKGYVGYLDILHRQLDDEDKKKSANSSGLVIDQTKNALDDQDNAEQKNDIELERGVYEAMERGDFELSLDLVSKIESEEVLHGVVEKVIAELIEQKQFSIAKKFLRTIHNMDFYTQQLNVVLESQRTYLDQGNGESTEAVSGEDEEVVNKVEIKKVSDGDTESHPVLIDLNLEHAKDFFPDEVKVETESNSNEVPNTQDVGDIVSEQVLNKVESDIKTEVIAEASEQLKDISRISDKELIDKYLSYQDADLPEEIKAEIRNYNDESESSKKYAYALRDLFTNYGVSMVEELASKMVSECIKVVKKIGLNPSKYSFSKTWAIWDIAKQFYYFTHQEEADTNYTIGNPMESDEKRKEIIFRHVGWEFYNQENKVKIANLIQDSIIRERLIELISKDPKSNGTLSSKDLAEIGEIIYEHSKDLEVKVETESNSNEVPNTQDVGDIVSEQVPLVENTTAVSDPETFPSSNEEINSNLEKARSEYANQLVIWKNSIREKKGKFRKVLQDLGVDKQLPQEEEPAELVEARRVYIEAKKAKNRDLIGVIFDVPNQNQKPLGIEVEEMNSRKERLLSSLETENSELEKRIVENIPPLERGILGKAFDKWTAMPRYQRIALSSTLAFTVGLAGGLGLGSAAVYGGMRAGKAVLGTVLSQGAGKTIDTFYNKKNKDKKEGVFGSYAKEINLENFEQKEKEMMAFLEKQKDERKRQILKKGLVMASVAGVSNLGIGGGGGTDIPDNINSTPDVSGPVGNTVENIDATSDLVEKPEVLDAKSNLDNFVESKSLVANEAPSILETKVELSSEGFLRDMHNLKANILSEYGGEIPDSLKPIMDKTPMELAKAFHFYDPETNASGLGFKGESIGLDSAGNIYYEHLDGTKQVIFDAKTGEFHHFDGEMVVNNSTSGQLYPNGKIGDDVTPINFEGNSSPEDPFSVNRSKVNFIPQDVVQQPNSLEKVNIPYEEPLITNTDLTPEEVITNTEQLPVETISTPLQHIELEGGKFVDVVNIEGQKSVIFNDIKIGQEIPFGDKKILVLDDQYQDGEQYAEIRKAFAKAFENDVKTDVIGPYPEALPFEGGKVYISYNVPNDVNSVRLFLNGKEIAVGSTSNLDGSGFPKLKFHSDLKGGWLLADNAYERAFKYVNKLIKAGKIDLKI